MILYDEMTVLRKPAFCATKVLFDALRMLAQIEINFFLAGSNTLKSVSFRKAAFRHTKYHFSHNTIKSILSPNG